MRLPRFNALLRLYLVGCGVVALIWMSFEDNSTVTVAIIGAVLFCSGWGVWLISRFGGAVLRGRQALLSGVLCGAVAGAGSVLTITLLMFFKSAWHAHPVLDYPLPVMASMLERTPAWTAAGALLGSGLMLIALGFSGGQSDSASSDGSANFPSTDVNS